MILLPIMQKLLILLSIASCATSQDKFNISGYDSQLRDIFNGLVETEKKIGNFLANLNDFVDEIGKSNKSRFSLDLSHLQLVLQLQSSIGNFESYQQLTGCANVVSKISEIDVDMKKFGDFKDRLELNMTELYHRNLHVTYDFVLYRNLQVSQQDILDLILGVNEAIVQYLFYILQLQSSIQYEKSIAANLKLFLTNYCECDDSVYGVSHNTNSNSPLSEMEAALTTRQARVATAANKTLLEAQKLAESKNVTRNEKLVSKELTKFCQKVMKIDDYTNVTLPFTNTCSDLSKVQNFMTYRRFHYTQVLSFVMTNSSVLGFYKNLMNSSNGSDVMIAIDGLEVELRNYTDDLAVQLSYLIPFASAMRKDAMVMKLFCGCRPVSNATTTTTTKASTTRKLIFSSATFLTSTENSNSDSTTTPSRTTKKLTTSRTSTTAVTETYRTRSTVPKITTIPPYSNPACSFTKPLADMTGTYIKTACLMEIASNGTYGRSLCEDNSMKLLTVDSNMTKTAVTIFVQETLSEGNFWISGGNGSEICNFVAVDGSGLVINQTECSYSRYYSICEYKDSKVPSKVGFPTNLDACGLVFPVFNEADRIYTRYACVMSYTRSYTDSSYNCMLNGMELLKIEPISVMKTLNEFLVSLFGNSSGVLMWVNATAKAGGCAYLDGNVIPFAVGSGSCDKLQWSMCEAPFDESY